MPDHPVVTEVYTDPSGLNDGPVGRDFTNLHQEFVEIYLPPAASLAPGLNKDALRLTFYEVEGDIDSSGPDLVNYRFDLPTFDLDPSNGLTVGAIARPSSGVVVLGWVDYVGNPPTGLAGGNASSRIGLVNGGITSTDGTYVFIALNGHHFQGNAPPGGGGTANFPVLGNAGESEIDLPSEASSGVIQNGSAAYLLVNGDLAGFVQLCDDQHAVDCASGAFPNLPNNTLLLNTPCLHDGLAGNDDSGFSVFDQPSPDGDNIDLGLSLPPGGAFSLLVAQIPESETAQPAPGTANGFARKFVDAAKTTETAALDDPVEDATTAYRQVRNNGPFFPTPGRAAQTTTAPELSVALSAEQNVQVLAETTGRPGLLAANVGGNFAINLSASPGASSNPPAATFASGPGVSGVSGQSLGFPSVAVTVPASASHGATASSTITVAATNANGGDPPVVGPIQMTTLTATVLKPTSGQNAAGQPFQATVFAAVQTIVQNAGVANELRATSLGAFLAGQPNIAAVETLGNGAALINASTDISNPFVVQPMVRELPADGEECVTWLHSAGPPGRLSLAQTVTGSAEVQSGATTYETTIGTCIGTGETVIRAIRLNVPAGTKAFGGGFTPTEPVNFVDAKGTVGSLRSGLSNATTTRTFEIAIVETNVRLDGTIETGATDDFGLIVQAEAVEPGSPIAVGEFVFLSFTGGLQGADIDSLNIAPGPNVATVIYLDLDNLHAVLGIRDIEALYVVDGSGTGEVDVIEAFVLPVPSEAALDSALPATNQSLWRTKLNTARLTFGSDISAPSSGAVSIRRMLPGGQYGPELSTGFQFTVENDGLGNPRILKIVDTDPPDLLHREWYAIRNTGAWPGVAGFTVQYVVQMGDANNDGQVLNLDAGLINAAIPNFNAGDADRRDIDGSTTILSSDVSNANSRIPSFPAAKPNGH